MVIDASEFMHAIYDDLSQINEMLSLNSPSLTLEGTAFFFNAFQVVSSLEPLYLQALTRAATFHNMLERSNIDGNKVVVEVISLQPANYGLESQVNQPDSSDEEDMTAVIYHIQTVQPTKQKPGTQEEEKAAAKDEGAKVAAKKDETKTETKKDEKKAPLKEDSDDFDEYES